MKDLTKKQKKIFFIIFFAVGILWLVTSAPDYFEKRKAAAKEKAELQAKIEVKGENPLDTWMNTDFGLSSIGEKWIIYDHGIKLTKNHDKNSGYVGSIPKETIVTVINIYGSYKLCRTENMLGWIDSRSVKWARKL